MPKSSSEYVADFLLGFLPGLLPKPLDAAAKSAVDTFKDQLESLLKQPRLRRELMDAARKAENDFRGRARNELGNDILTQAVASLPLYDRELFQLSLQSLPEHLNEDILADHLQKYISDDWKGDFAPEDLRKGTAIYLNCLKVQLLRVEGFGDLIARLEVLRTGERTEQILAIVRELIELVRLLIEQLKVKESVVAALFTIPPPVTDFTGRETELEKLKASFQNGAIITGLSGGGGVGKTELARRLAQDIAGDYSAARMSIDLLGTSDKPLTPEDAMRRLLEPFYPNQKLPEDPQGMKGLYQQTFASQKALLLLDNAANEMQVRPLVPPQPSAAIITSRKHFGLTEFGLNPLRLDVLSPGEARDLLRKASPKIVDAPDAKVDALATLCGSLPLALRVAASLLNDRDDWILEKLLKRLADERTRLERLKRDGDLDLDVEAALSLSYNLLDDYLKKYFRQLGVFNASFIPISAQAIWRVEDDTKVEDLLGKFTNLSLLNLLPSPFGETQDGDVIYLYALHDLTRLFATDRLFEDEGEAKETVMRHADHFLGWASATDDLYRKGNENILRGLSQFRFIYPHLQTAYDRLSHGERKYSDSQDSDRWLSEFPNRCAYVLELHLPPRQRISLMETALAAARKLRDKNAEGVHLGNLGNAYSDLGDYQKAIEFYDQVLVLHREIDDKKGEGIDLGNLGNAYFLLGDAKKAIEFYKGAMIFAREIGDRRNEGNWLGNLGNAYAEIGETKKAIEFYEQQLVIVQEIGDRRGEGAALGNLGNAYAALNDINKAIEYDETSLLIKREIGDKRGEANSLARIGFYYSNLDEKEKTRACWNQALQIYYSIEDPNAARVENWLSDLDNDEPENQQVSVQDFVRAVIQAYRGKSPQAGQMFDALGKMIGDPNAPPEIQELAKVLRRVMSGVKEPDLSALPEELAKLVREELARKE